MATQTIDLLKNSSFETKIDALITAVSKTTPADGFSPVVTIMTNETDGYTDVTITDKSGPQTFRVTDGALITTVKPTYDATTEALSFNAETTSGS